MITKNIISSGCIFYPIKLTCYEKLSWVNIEHIQKVSDSAEAWTKGWSNKKSDVDLSQNEFNKNFNWIKPWSDVHLKLIIKILLPYLIFCSLLIITFKINNELVDGYGDMDGVFSEWECKRLCQIINEFIKTNNKIKIDVEIAELSSQLKDLNNVSTYLRLFGLYRSFQKG